VSELPSFAEVTSTPTPEKVRKPGPLESGSSGKAGGAPKMPAPAPPTRRAQKSQEAAVASLANQTQTAPEVVKRLYDKEMAALRASAKVKNLISVIAGRRVKTQLLARKANDGAGSDRRTSR
jgi:Protein of unknown function (DUF3562)